MDAVRDLCAVESRRRELSLELSAHEQRVLDRLLDSGRDALGEDAFASAQEAALGLAIPEIARAGSAPLAQVAGRREGRD
jgi:hypothetical protein